MYMGLNFHHAYESVWPDIYSGQVYIGEFMFDYCMSMHMHQPQRSNYSATPTPDRLLSVRLLCVCTFLV